MRRHKLQRLFGRHNAQLRDTTHPCAGLEAALSAVAVDRQRGSRWQRWAASNLLFTLALDGVYVRDPKRGELHFTALPVAQVLDVGKRTEARVSRVLRKSGRAVPVNFRLRRTIAEFLLPNSGLA